MHDDTATTHKSFYSYKQATETGKEMESGGITEDYEIGKGWPHYKNMSILTEDERKMLFEAAAPEPAESLAAAYYEGKTGEKKMEWKEDWKTKPHPHSTYGDATAEELQYLRTLHSDWNAKCMNGVVKVIESYDYDGSPLYEEYVGKRLIVEILGKLMDWAEKHDPDLRDIVGHTDKGMGSKYHLLACCFEGLVLMEIFCRRRNKYFCMVKAEGENFPFI